MCPFVVKGFFCTFAFLPSNEHVQTCLVKCLIFKKTLVLYLILMFVQKFILCIVVTWKTDYCSSLHFITV